MIWPREKVILDQRVCLLEEEEEEVKEVKEVESKVSPVKLREH